MDVDTVTSPGGIEAWRVEDYGQPMFALRFAFMGGASQDPPGKEGLAHFVRLMLQQGKTDLTASAFQERIEDLAIHLNFDSGWDSVRGSVEALSETRIETADLINLALTQARFDEDAIERVRLRLLSLHGGEARKAEVVAKVQWHAMAFAGHPYAGQSFGNDATIRGITAGDLRRYCRRCFAKDNLKVVCAGDITVDELGEFLDRSFGNLPARAELVELPTANPVVGGRLRVAELDIPQSVVAFGVGAVRYDSPDFIPAYVLSLILGGDHVSSRLGSELRGKRGLAISTGAWLDWRKDAAILRGTVATRNDKVALSLEIIRAEMQKMSDGELSQTELDDAKNYLNKSSDLALRSNSAIAANLLGYAIYGFGPDFIERRRAMISAVTLDELKRVARHLLDPENLIVSIAGTPAQQLALGR